jgi:hypothetical protein
MATSEHYRRFAQECLEMERAAKDERARATLIQMVQVWFRLAPTKQKRQTIGLTSDRFKRRFKHET